MCVAPLTRMTLIFFPLFLVKVLFFLQGEGNHSNWEWVEWISWRTQDFKVGKGLNGQVTCTHTKQIPSCVSDGMQHFDALYPNPFGPIVENTIRLNKLYPSISEEIDMIKYRSDYKANRRLFSRFSGQEWCWSKCIKTTWNRCTNPEKISFLQSSFINHWINTYASDTFSATATHSSIANISDHSVTGKYSMGMISFVTNPLAPSQLPLTFKVQNRNIAAINLQKMENRK